MTRPSLAIVTDLREVDGGVRYLSARARRRRTCSGSWPQAGAAVERFAVQAPSLDEVFIRTVAGDPRAEAVR